jgi:hypothetical protein
VSTDVWTAWCSAVKNNSCPKLAKQPKIASSSRAHRASKGVFSALCSPLDKATAGTAAAKGVGAVIRRKWMDLAASWKFVATILAFGFVAAMILGMI